MLQITNDSLQNSESYRAYVRTLIFLYTQCAEKYVKASMGLDARVLILHSLDYNLYSEIRTHGEPLILTAEQIEEIEAMMRKMVQDHVSLTKANYSLEEAGKILQKENRPDLLRLVHYRSISTINLYQLDDEFDYFYGPLCPDISKVNVFDLIPYKDGIIVRTPAPDEPTRLRRFVPKPHLFSVFQQAREWSRKTGVENVSMLNDVISEGKIAELIQVSEALHAGYIAEIASKISGRSRAGRPDGLKDDTMKRLVLVAGPSSSGKTTFAQKLCIQLKAEGLKPHMISMDNYFHPRAMVPFGPDGKQDFESISCLDTELFSEHMQALLKGKSIPLPTYNFISGEREYNGETLQLADQDVLVVEGIHGLNSLVSEGIPREQIFKIYISAITMLGIDDHNRIPTTDSRLLRRMVRDNQHRGYSASDTLDRWPSVMKGEEKNIFPFQEEADVMFNSSHLYELAVLKSYAEPLLFRIGPEDPTYDEARRLIRFLSYFLSISSELVPRSSLIREFIGGGYYHQ
ncbi:MAG: nucleoside kinase [Firmicutes bacterium]|nr:nucleoside kinase [Bacillota bacterium]